MAKNGKKPNARQAALLTSYNRNPKDWWYISQRVIGSDCCKSLGKYENKMIYWIFQHRTTGQEISLQVEP